MHTHNEKLCKHGPYDFDLCQILINNRYDPRRLDKAIDKIKRKNAQKKKIMKQRILPH